MLFVRMINKFLFQSQSRATFAVLFGKYHFSRESSVNCSLLNFLFGQGYKEEVAFHALNLLI